MTGVIGAYREVCHKGSEGGLELLVGPPHLTNAVQADDVAGPRRAGPGARCQPLDGRETSHFLRRMFPAESAPLFQLSDIVCKLAIFSMDSAKLSSPLKTRLVTSEPGSGRSLLLLAGPIEQN